MSEKEDLSALKREDLVYKAKLAEQAERCEATRGEATDARTRARRADARGRDAMGRGAGLGTGDRGQRTRWAREDGIGRRAIGTKGTRRRSGATTGEGRRRGETWGARRRARDEGRARWVEARGVGREDDDDDDDDARAGSERTDFFRFETK